MEKNSKSEDHLRGLNKVGGCDDPNRKVDIVFVHGVGGAESTWYPKDTPEKFWPAWLSEDFPQFGVWLLGYAADISKWKEESMPLADRGNNVLEQLSNEGLGNRPLIFITHSLGGIVVKQLLRHGESFGVARWERITKATRGIAFIGTPHSGARIANFAEFVSVFLRTNEVIKELAQHEPRLRELHGWFLNYHNKQKLICRSYCEMRELRFEFWRAKSPKGILVVDATSAEPNIPSERAIPLDEDHISICKPTSRNAELYKSIKAFIQDCIEPSHSVPNDSFSRDPTLEPSSEQVGKRKGLAVSFADNLRGVVEFKANIQLVAPEKAPFLVASFGTYEEARKRIMDFIEGKMRDKFINYTLTDARMKRETIAREIVASARPDMESRFMHKLHDIIFVDISPVR